MNRVRHWNPHQHTMEIEPGVTQGQLADLLTATGDTHFLNVTGAGLSTSVLGNALERGIGYFGARNLDLLGAEVLLANGDVVHLGRGNRPFGSGAPLGPELEGLLLQSGWAIVTAATLALHRKPEVMGACVLEIERPEHLAAVIDELGSILAEGWIQSVPHVFNRLRLATTFGERAEGWPAWLAVVPLRGPRALVTAMVKELQGRLGQFARIGTLNLGSPEEEISELSALCPLLEGRPIDLALFSMSKTLQEKESPEESIGFDPESGNAGLIHVTPSCELEGATVERLVQLVNRLAAARDGKLLPLSFNLVSARYGCLVISICFPRDSLAEKQAAQKLANEMLAQLTHAGFRPYRLGLEQAAKLLPFEAPLGRLCQRLEEALNPEGLLAPSRYTPLWNPGRKRREPAGALSFLKMIEREQQRTEEVLCAENVVSL